jgi:signal transduction histidine kinase/CheY-like chemotaxis protein
MRRIVLSIALNVSSILAPCMAALYIIQQLESDPSDMRILPLTIYTLVFPLLRLLRPKLAFNTTAVLFLAALLGLAFILQVRTGLNFSTAAIQIWILLFAGLVFGARAVIAATIISLFFFTVAAAAVFNNWVQPIGTNFWSQYDPLVWLRSGILLAVFGITSASAVASTITRLDKESKELRASLDRETAQRKALELAATEKAKIRETLAEAQRVEALGRLASGVAHDFNNSLTIITNSAEIAQLQKDNPEELQRFLFLIKKTALEAAKMTSSLLAIGRKDPSKKETACISQIIEKLNENLLRLLPEDIRLIINASPAGSVYIDTNQFERSILNLVINAKDAIKQDGEIEVGCSLVESDKSAAGNSIQEVLVYVKDNGVGMAAEVRDRIFEPFFTTKKSGSGVGLGMALLKSLVNEAQGRIEIKSELGMGTTVSIYLPISDADVTQKLLENASIDQPLLCPFNARILLVEDNPDVLATCSETLARNGHKITTAANGDDALEIVLNQELQFDLLCIDGVIPGVSSGEIINQVQLLRPTTRIVVCSGYIEEELVLRGIRAGELAYIAKPYSNEHFLNLISQELTKNL